MKNQNQYTVEIWEPQNMPKSLIRKCKSLSYRDSGEMSFCLDKLYNYPKEGRHGIVYIVKSQETLLGRLLVYKSEFTCKQTGPYVHVYVRKTQRNTGIAKTLLTAFLNDYKEAPLPQVYNGKEGDSRNFLYAKAIENKQVVSAH